MNDSSIRKRPRQRLLCAALTFALVSSAHGGEPFAPTPSETVLLPAYCRDRLDDEHFKQHKRKWASLGDGFDHVHHYCFALNFINRAKAKSRDPRGRKQALVDASNNLSYIMQRTDDRYILAPDFYIAKGEINLMQGDIADAQVSFTRATEIKPDYPKGWLALSDMLKQSNRREAARQALEKGLLFAPDKHKDFMRKKLAEFDMGESGSAVASPKPH